MWKECAVVRARFGGKRCQEAVVCLMNPDQGRAPFPLASLCLPLLPCHWHVASLAGAMEEFCNIMLPCGLPPATHQDLESERLSQQYGPSTMDNGLLAGRHPFQRIFSILQVLARMEQGEDSGVDVTRVRYWGGFCSLVLVLDTNTKPITQEVINTLTLMDQARKEDPTILCQLKALRRGHERRVNCPERATGSSPPSGIPEDGRVRSAPAHRANLRRERQRQSRKADRAREAVYGRRTPAWTALDPTLCSSTTSALL